MVRDTMSEKVNLIMYDSEVIMYDELMTYDNEMHWDPSKMRVPAHLASAAG